MTVFDFRSLLAIAAMFGQVEMVEILIEAGAEVNDLDGPGYTPLMFAAEDGEYEVTRILLQAGADPHIEDRNGETALDKANHNHHQEVAALIAKYLN